MNEASCTPVTSKDSKKRELSSPEFDSDNKKNRILSDSIAESESDISDLSVSETMASNVVSSEAPAGLADASAHFTLDETQLQKIASLMKESFQPQVAQILQDTFQHAVTDLVNSIVSGVLEGLNAKIASLEGENMQLRQRVQRLEEATDTAEQYSRRNCLRITGAAESDNEDTDDYVINLARNIGVDITLQDIDRSHRLGKLQPENAAKPRDIVVKFATYRMRAKFYKARVLTKDRGFRGVFVNEHLTRTRSKILYQARRRVKSKQLKSAWSFDGTIMIKHLDDSVQKISSENDLPVYVSPDSRETDIAD